MRWADLDLLGQESEADRVAREQLAQRIPIDFEAHIMIMRAYAALRVDAPFERRGGMTKARYNVLRMLHGEHRQDTEPRQRPDELRRTRQAADAACDRLPSARRAAR